MGNLTVCQNSVSRKTAYRNSDTNNTIEEEKKKEKYEPFVVDKFYLDKIENEFIMHPNEIMQEQRVFLDFCKKNNKSYKDMSRSLYVHIRGKRSVL